MLKFPCFSHRLCPCRVYMQRRNFLKTAALTIASPWVVLSTVFGQAVPSERVTVGHIGVGNQGGHLSMIANHHTFFNFGRIPGNAFAINDLPSPGGPIHSAWKERREIPFNLRAALRNVSMIYRSVVKIHYQKCKNAANSATSCRK